MRLTICLLVAFGSVNIVTSEGLNEEFSWSRITYRWPRQGEVNSRFAFGQIGRRPISNSAIIFEGNTNADNQTDKSNIEIGNAANEASGTVNFAGSIDYQYVNNIPMGANVWQDKLFITIPRRRLGVPSTLNYVPLKNAERHNVPLIPYPNWDINLFPDTSGSGENFVSVYRTAIDVCDRMWFVDTGTVETIGNRTTIKPHQIIIMNLRTDQIMHRFNLPDDVMTSATILASLNIDIPKGSCGDAYAYFPDLAGYGLIVYSLRETRAWRVNHNFFFLEPLAGDFSIAGHQFQWNDGIFSVELSDLKANGYREMYFHSMAGTHIYRVSTRILRNQTLATRSYHGNDFEVVGDKGPNSQTSTADLHKPTGVMFLALVNRNAVGCWNTNKDLATMSIVQKDDERMIYPSDVRVSGDNVYVLTNTMPGFLYGQLNYDVTNFRVWSNDVRKAVRGTACQGG